MIYNEFNVSKHLRDYIECLWIADVRHTGLNFEFLPPDLSTELVFCLNKKFIYNINNVFHATPLVHILSCRETGIKLQIDPFTKLLGIRFKPGKIKYLIGAELFNSEDKVINAEEIDKYFTFLHLKLSLCDSPKDMLGAIEKTLSEKLSEIPYHEEQTYKWIEYLIQNPTIKIEHFSSSICNTCSRNVQIRIKNYINNSPTKIKNIGLFKLVLDNMYSSPDLNLTKVAFDTGFYDQSHFNNFFKKITNQSPREFILSNKFLVQTALKPKVEIYA